MIKSVERQSNTCAGAVAAHKILTIRVKPHPISGEQNEHFVVLGIYGQNLKNETRMAAGGCCHEMGTYDVSRHLPDTTLSRHCHGTYNVARHYERVQNAIATLFLQE